MKAYPTGTTQEQWDRYEVELADHEKYIKNYEFFLKRITKHLEFVQPDKSWAVGEIYQTIMNEIRKSSSMDAPNKPGYYRSNND